VSVFGVVEFLSQVLMTVSSSVLHEVVALGFAFLKSVLDCRD
jgi:hypothetical protein